MTLERESWSGPFTVNCDTCGTYEETHSSDFASAMAKIKSWGWKSVKEDGEWFHRCPKCK